MDHCIVCGADLRQRDEWCARCYAPRNTAHPAYRGPGAYDADAYDDPRVPKAHEPFEVRFSRFRGGPTSMGAFGRSLTTMLALLTAYAVYMYLFQVMLGESGGKYLLLYAVVAVPVLLFVLRKVWRPTRIT